MSTIGKRDQRRLHKRSHTKSRRGCDQCKQRRVKCDENDPICSNCERLHLPCTHHKRPPIQDSHSTTTNSNPHDSVRPSPHSWSLTDLELLHHYSTCSCVRFPSYTVLHKLWTKDIPILSFSHPYLVHQILAVAALHRYVEDRSQTDLANIATHHRALALKDVQPALSNANPSDSSSIALFAFAGLTAIYAFGELNITLEQEGDEHDHIGHLIACFRLSRGIGTIVIDRKQEIQDSWASAMINMSADTELENLRSKGLKFVHADALFEMISTHSRALDDVAACMDAAVCCLEYLQLLMWHSDQENPRIYQLIMTWPHKISPRFCELIDLRDPVALVLLAHYAVLMSMRKRLWWLASWPELLLKQIGSVLGADWDRWLEWPRSMLESMSDDPNT